VYDCYVISGPRNTPVSGEDPEFTRAKYFFRDKFLVSYQFSFTVFLFTVFTVNKTTVNITIFYIYILSAHLSVIKTISQYWLLQYLSHLNKDTSRDASLFISSKIKVTNCYNMLLGCQQQIILKQIYRELHRSYVAACKSPISPLYYIYDKF